MEIFSIEPRCIGTYISYIEGPLIFVEVNNCFMFHLLRLFWIFGWLFSFSSSNTNRLSKTFPHTSDILWIFSLEISLTEPFIFLLLSVLVHAIPAILHSCSPRNFFNSFLFFIFCFLDSTFSFSLVYSLNLLNIPYEFSEKGSI